MRHNYRIRNEDGEIIGYFMSKREAEDWIAKCGTPNADCIQGRMKDDWADLLNKKAA